MTQTEVNGLLAQAAEEARRAGIPISDQINPQVPLNHRARNRFGCCIRQGNRYTIELSAQLAAEGTAESILQVLAHEILHTCQGCSNHGNRWKSYAARMNRLYGYHIRRTDDFVSLGLMDHRPIRYWVVCAQCGQRLPRMKRSPLIDHPEHYRCRCGGPLQIEYIPT